MARGRIILAGIGGCILVAFAAQPILAQTTYDDSAPSREDLEAGFSSPPRLGGGGYNAPVGPVAQPTGMEQIRIYPHPGPPQAATHGFPNYDLPNWHFDIWFRPKAWGLTKRERCAIPDPWRPRGYGNLFARQSTAHRMDYHRYVLVDRLTGYGPSYYLLKPDQRCCVRTPEGHVIYMRSREEMWQLEEALYSHPQDPRNFCDICRGHGEDHAENCPHHHHHED